jgi:uncharacterized protein YkwD
MWHAAAMRLCLVVSLVLFSGCSSPAEENAPVTDTGTAVDTAPPEWPVEYAALEQQILEETNRRRAAGASCGSRGTFGPAPPLTMHPQLTASARGHSKDMATRDFFSHNTPEGLTPSDRIKAAGYVGTTTGENIAAGNATAAKTMEQWMNSEGHCANIMNPRYTHLGVGYFPNPSARLRHYWTQNFGAGG